MLAVRVLRVALSQSIVLPPSEFVLFVIDSMGRISTFLWVVFNQEFSHLHISVRKMCFLH